MMSKKNSENHYYSHIATFNNKISTYYHSPPILYWKYRLLNLPPVARQICDADAIMNTPVNRKNQKRQQSDPNKKISPNYCFPCSIHPFIGMEITHPQT
jgi:hypothetical protein